MPISHPVHPSDLGPLAKLRELTPHTKDTLSLSAWRALFDDIMAQTPAAAGVTYEEARVGGVAGWWCRPAGARADAALLHLHGGGYAAGSAKAYRHFAGQIAARAGVPSFVPDYRLAPEHPFPAAIDDVAAVYAALAESHSSLILVGDSAGGGLALSQLAARPRKAPRGAVALSPLTDLALTGESLRTRADVDRLLTRAGLEITAGRYAGAHDPRDPRISPLHGDLAGLPPVLIHVGEDEILLDDSLRYGARHPRCTVHVWAGMPHVFPMNVGVLHAAELALEEIGTFVGSLV